MHTPAELKSHQLLGIPVANITREQADAVAQELGCKAAHEPTSDRWFFTHAALMSDLSQGDMHHHSVPLELLKKLAEFPLASLQTALAAKGLNPGQCTSTIVRDLADLPPVSAPIAAVVKKPALLKQPSPGEQVQSLFNSVIQTMKEEPWWKELASHPDTRSGIQKQLNPTLARTMELTRMFIGHEVKYAPQVELPALRQFFNSLPFNKDPNDACEQLKEISRERNRAAGGPTNPCLGSPDFAKLLGRVHGKPSMDM